ncbi:hypothetical protein P8452_60341 [Trifolium repens]|nr:hypothetical protein P8452_60341 [Trifolium repens]
MIGPRIRATHGLRTTGHPKSSLGRYKTHGELLVLHHLSHSSDLSSTIGHPPPSISEAQRRGCAYSVRLKVSRGQFFSRNMGKEKIVADGDDEVEE